MENQKNENQTYELKVSVETKTGVREDGTKYSFKIFKGVTKNGKKCRFKVTRNCTHVPKDDGIYIFTVLKNDINEDKREYYLTYWIKDIQSFITFDNFVSNKDGEDLPF